MCGIIGQFNRHQNIELGAFRQRLQQLAHRGPDGQGYWICTEGKRALGHTRLAFLDLSEQGHQPFVSADQQFILSFNGEIYNYLELRETLQAHYQFKTQTDTEVVLAAYLHWGKDCVRFFEGMFAFCILDMAQNTAFLARDAFGIKPLYYTLTDQFFLFASELKGIIPTEGLSLKIDRSALIDYLVYRYIPSPKTIWEGIFKLEPASTAVLDLTSFEIDIQKYWDPVTQTHYKEEPFEIATYHQEFQKDVAQHLAADVPIGGFLSGGYDSSALALAAKKLDKPYVTFTVGFKDWDQSEQAAAANLAEQLEFENVNVELDQSSLQMLEQMPLIYDEPIADISIIPTFAVSKLAAQQRKAVLSGEGADELFLGYHWQKEWLALQQKPLLKRILKPKTDLLAFYVKSMEMGRFEREILKQALTPEWQNDIPNDLFWFYRKQLKPTKDNIRAIQYLDQKCFMAELVLTKIDRASMANSLEVRVPFLSKRVFEQIHATALNRYVQKGISKLPIYAYLRQTVSKTQLDRPKQGFVGPDSYYMNKEFYIAALKDSFLVKDGIIRSAFIDNELSMQYNWRLWKLVVLEKWYAHWRQFITKQ